MDRQANCVLRNAQIYTMDSHRSWADALAIHAGRLVAIGSDADVAPWIGKETQVFDLGGRFVMPGLYDSHIHSVEGGLQTLYQCTISPRATAEEAAAAVQRFAQANPQSEWIYGGGWHLGLRGTANRGLLDAVVADRPVFLWDLALHNAWVNSKAFAVAGIDRQTPDPLGGQIEHTADGEPTGILLETAATALFRHVPNYSLEQTEAGAVKAMQMLNRAGVIGIKEASTNRQALCAFKKLADEGRLSLRVAACILVKPAWREDPADLAQLLADRQQFAAQRLRINYAKLFLDGVPIARTAAFLEPYVGDSPETHDPYANLLIEREELIDDVVRLDGLGLTIKMHATGDAAVRAGLDAVAMARARNGGQGNGGNRLRHEFAHAAHVQRDDIQRMAELNCVADFSPFLWFPSDNLIKGKIPLVGKERSENAFRMKTMQMQGVEMIAGTDWPAMTPSVNLWHGIEAMVTRRNPYVDYPGTLSLHEALTLDEALTIFTINGARAQGIEADAGSLEVGKFADLIVLDRNPFAIEATEISKIEVLMTMLEGETVCQREGWQGA